MLLKKVMFFMDLRGRGRWRRVIIVLLGMDVMVVLRRSVWVGLSRVVVVVVVLGVGGMRMDYWVWWRWW